ncbi:uncharacterized protein LOC114931291 [Nylanderia fulva]|uniref:uncharacterized protein LOC114931291 n=1 Tax=Nylanderia fulva TaxID=613905 RepID=UPI0010FB63F9|nr:uncharacterized protein LOC114931291 [Nylanderia fulva]
MDKDNIRTLLLLYQQHPCLYVVKSIDYHNRIKREKVLQTICDQYTEITEQPLTIEIAKKKINNLRSQYLDYLNKIKQSKASGASTDEIYKPTWWLYEDMKFLDPYISQRKGESSIKERFSKEQSVTMALNENENNNEHLQFLDVYNILENKDHNKENIHQNEFSQSKSSSSISTPRSSICITPVPKRKRTETIKSETSSIEQNKFWTIASNAIESIAKNEKMEDSLRHWILYLENELRKIKISKN